MDVASESLGDTGISAHVLRTRETLVINEDMPDAIVKYGSRILGPALEKSSVFVPLIVGDRARGLLNLLDMHREHAFSDSDVRLLQTLANSMSVALENARLFDETQRLLKETEQRNAELAVINSIQQGMAAELDFQGIVDLVGDKLREVLRTGDIGIRWHDPQDQAGPLPRTTYEHGRAYRRRAAPARATGGSQAPDGRRAQPVVYNNSRRSWRADGIAAIRRHRHEPNRVSSFPILGGDRVLGVHRRSRTTSARTPSASPTCACCSTVAASMGVALENARLFDETQRLLKETEQRNAELAVINSIQQGMAAELDFQAIVDLVGDKLREVLHDRRHRHPLVRREGRTWLHYLYVYEHGVRLRRATRASTRTVGPVQRVARRADRSC